MDLTSLLDPLAIVAIGGLALSITQAIKDMIPEKGIKPVNILIALGLAFLYYYKPGIPPNYDEIIKMAIQGIAGGLGAFSGYDFLSAKKSAPFTLSSKPPAPPKPVSETFTIEALDPVKFAEFMKSPKGMEAIQGAIRSALHPPAEVTK